MRLFGDVLPFVGFRLIDQAELERRGMADALTPSPIGQYSMLEVEWLGHGFTIGGHSLTDR